MIYNVHVTYLTELDILNYVYMSTYLLVLLVRSGCHGSCLQDKLMLLVANDLYNDPL